MKLARDNFKNSISSIKNEIVCNIPVGTKKSKITEIDSETFYDWEKLQYVYIPNSILVVHKNAFLWDNIKVIFVDLTKTIIEDLPNNVKVLPILGNESALFEMLNIIMEVKKTLEFNPDNIYEIENNLKKLSSEFVTKTTLEKEKIKVQQKELEELLKELDMYTNKSKEVTQETLKKLEDYINNSIDEKINDKSQELKEMSSKIKEEISNLKSLMSKCEETKLILNSLKDTIQTSLEKYRKDIDKEVENALKEVTKQYESKKQEIIDNIVNEATKILIEKNPCKNIIINISDVKKKFETKDLFHKDFEKILKLVCTKVPILLKGPAGCGKNVILEQISKALELQFYYLNDVTEEYKVMGFVDANGKYIETQFFKAFTNGGLMFIDEIDSSHPSALLSINAAIGTGYNHYMAFPNGEFYKANENFHLVAAANTFGTGSDMIYVGRQALDGASLNRFIPVSIDYDKNLEESLIRNTAILPLFWEVRDIIRKNTIRHVISTRNIKVASDLIDTNSFSLEEIFDWTIIQSMDTNDLNIIASRLTSNDNYTLKFKNHLLKHHNVSTRL